MCGVLAWYAPCGRTDRRRFQLALRRLKHRGPDGEGFFESNDGRVLLGHRRLDVIAPENAHQPVRNETDEIHTVVNGEIYDAEELQGQLRRRGHQFRTESDSELLVHLYEEYGAECVEHLRGEFAFVLWDERQQQLLAARDRFGVKPLYFAEFHGGVLIASQVQALLAAGIRAAWDPQSVFQTCSLQYLAPGKSLFGQIDSLPPAHRLTITASGMRQQRYWQIPTPQANRVDDPQHLMERCRRRLVHAVTRRLRSDVPLCFHLSGGVDSGSVAGIASSVLQRPVDVYSLTFEQQRYNELPIIQQSARHLQARLHCVEVSRRDIVRTLPQAVCAAEGVAINGHLSAKYLLHQRMRRDGFTVTLTGEGADEAFFGYAHLRSHLPGSTRRLPGKFSEQTSRGMMLPHGEGLDTTAAQDVLGCVPVWLQAKATLGRRVRQLQDPDFLNAFSDSDPVRELAESLQDHILPGQHPAVIARNTWTQCALSGYILRTLGDGSEMPHSIEGRVPFLDQDLWEELKSIPLDAHSDPGISKPFLRQAVRPFVASKVGAREKHPLDAPPVLVDDDPFVREYLQDTLRSAAFRAQPFFCSRRVLQCLDQAAEWDAVERQAWDAALMLMVSIVELNSFLQQEQYSDTHDPNSAAVMNA